MEGGRRGDLHSDTDAWHAAAWGCGSVLVCLRVGVNDASVTGLARTLYGCSGHRDVSSRQTE